MKPHPDISWRSVEGQAVLIKNKEGMIHVLNETGTLLWQHLEEGEKAMAEMLVGDYGLKPKEAKQDVAEFVERLRELGVLDEEN